jgi:hypothetical protein
MLKILKNIFNEKNIENIYSAKCIKNKRNRQNYLTKSECLAHRLLYTSKNSTKVKVSKDIAFENNKTVSRQAFDKQFKKYNVNFYKEIHNNISQKYSNFTNSKIINKITNSSIKTFEINSNVLNEYVCIAVDGSCSNNYENHKIITTNNLYFYNLNDNINIDNFICKTTKNNKNKKTKITETNRKRKEYNDSNKNSEISSFKTYIEQNHKKLKLMYPNKKILFICDRAYHCHDLFDLLDQYKFNYIIRLRDGNQFIKNKIKDKQIINIKKRTKVIKYNIPIKIVYNDNIEKIKKSVKYLEEYFLLTNINNISDSEIEKIYQARWSIEIFFKLNKKNTKLALFKEKNKDNHEINKICISIINMIIKILLHVYVSEVLKKQNKNKNNLLNLIKELKYVNYSLFLQAIYDKILIDLVCGKLKKARLINFLKSYVDINKNKLNRKFPRVSLLPFSKWYVKKYHKSYNWSKIINAIKSNTIDDLNKNLKSKANKIKDKISFDEDEYT